MRATRWISAAILAAALPAAAAGEPTLDEIVARHVSALGGLERVRSIQTLRQRGHVSAGAEREARVTRELKRPGKTRFEFTVQGVTAVFASNGRSGWQVSPFEGDLEPKPLPEDVLQEALEQGDIEGPLVEWQAKGHRLELVGKTFVSGRETFKLKLTLAQGAVLYPYLDAQSFRLVRTDSTRVVRGHPVQVETTFSEHKKTGGVLFPRRVEIAAVGRPRRLLVRVDEVEVNPPLADSRFELSPPPQP